MTNIKNKNNAIEQLLGINNRINGFDTLYNNNFKKSLSAIASINNKINSFDTLYNNNFKKSLSAITSINNRINSFDTLPNISALNKSINDLIGINNRKNIFDTLSNISNINNINRLHTFVNSAVHEYNHTSEEEFEIIIDEIPIIIIKSKLQEYFEIFQNLEIPNDIAIKLSFISYFILRLAPLLYILPALTPIMESLINILVIYGEPYIKELSKFKDPNIFAKKAAECTFDIIFGATLNILVNLFFKRDNNLY